MRPPPTVPTVFSAMSHAREATAATSHSPLTTCAAQCAKAGLTSEHHCAQAGLTCHSGPHAPDVHLLGSLT